MKALAHGYVWWPKIDADIEAKVKQCNQCQLSRPSSPAVPMHPWDWPECPWQRIHLDYAGPFMRKMFLIAIDAHSKWMEVKIINSATAQATIEHLRASFARFGLPEVVVTDNGTCFTSNEFQEFTQRNNIRHVRTAPYHPSSNGLAERAVQTFKLGMKIQTSGSLQTKLSRFLFHYRLTPNATTGLAPAELLLSRRPRSHLDFMAPHSLKDRVQRQQQKQKSQHDQHAKPRAYEQGDLVLIRDFCRQASSPWSPGTIVQSNGRQSYKVKLSDGQVVQRHADHIRERTTSCDDVEQNEELDVSPFPVSSQPMEQQATTQPTLHRSQRIRKPPDQFQN